VSPGGCASTKGFIADQVTEDGKSDLGTRRDPTGPEKHTGVGYDT